MSEEFQVLLFQRDFQQSGKDRYFLGKDQVITEVSALQVVRQAGTLICHDYWLIAPAIYKATGALHDRVVDLDDMSFLIEGKRLDKKKREHRGFLKAISDIIEAEKIKGYSEMYASQIPIDLDILRSISEASQVQWGRLCLAAGFSGELKRCLDVEFPVMNFLMLSMMRGISIDVDALRRHREVIEHDYYTALKQFAISYNLPFEVPTNEAARKYLERQGYDFSEVPLDYVVRLLPTLNEFGESFSDLRRLADSRAVLWSLSFGRRHIQPIVDVFGSITSRIYLRDPAIQGLAKRHRDIVHPTLGRSLSYVDYGQFEVGIMAALSGDAEMKALFSQDDLYTEVGKRLFATANLEPGQRKFAKRLFLSYAYGMSIRRLLDATSAQAIDRKTVKDFFGLFSRYEAWKKEIHHIFEKHGRIGTTEGNYMIRDSTAALEDKEKRSAVSQVVQGTASLIFKKALLKIKDIPGIFVKIPLHDAVLFEHDASFNPKIVVKAMEDVMTNHFSGAVRGKASVDEYFPLLARVGDPARTANS